MGRPTRQGYSAVDHRTYSGKDRYHCLKAVFVVTIGTNMPVAGCGLFLPKVYDGWLAEELDFNAQFARDPREWFLGDGHFSCTPRYLTSPKNQEANMDTGNEDAGRSQPSYVCGAARRVQYLTDDSRSSRANDGRI
jgi:hypothetical protein